MENQERIVELVDDKGVEISSSESKIDMDVGKEDNLEELPAKSESYVDFECGNSVPFDEEDDVPSDFFDDFSNQDFMAGLDVVDAWDDEEITDEKDKEKNIDGVRDTSHKKGNKRTERTRRRYSRSPVRSRYRNNEHNDRRRYSRDRDRKRKSRDAKSKDKQQKEAVVKGSKQETENDELTPDHRRDPEKTKRDIQKDKDKCAKTKEAKIISEKLKVVETGLVPPGTEMEVDLKQLKSAVIKESERKTTTINVREERRRRSKSTSVELVRSRILYREKRYSPIPRRISRSPDRNYERRFPYNKHSRSPYRGRSRSRSRSSHRRRITPDRRLYLEERRRIRRYRDSSPTILRRRSKDRSLEISPISNVSEREMWLRQRDRSRERHRMRKVSPSPFSDQESGSRKRSGDFLEELANKLKSEKKKKSFLKEIQERLNEPCKPELNYSIRASAPGPVPSPITGPNSIPSLSGQMHGPNSVSSPGFMPGAPPYFPPQIDPAPQYDQQFFIGQPDIFHNPPYQQPYMGHLSGPGVAGNMHGEVFGAPPASNSVVIPCPLSSPVNKTNYNKINVNILQTQKATEIQKEKDKEAIAKLFEDKKISLSDFLSMSAKHADPTKPVNVQKKIKVISLCQDAVKALGGDSKLNGRFFLKKTGRDIEKLQEGKFQSPLRKIPVVRFSFTTPSKGGDEKSPRQSTLNKLLASLGLIEQPTLVAPKPAPSPATSETSVKSASTRQQASTPVKITPRRYDPILGAKYQMKMCQTDPVRCHICEIRKARKFVDQGVQCEIKTTESGTQITDEDLHRLGIKVPVKDALRNQSLAHLTPAQLLARTMGQDETPMRDIFPAAKVLTPPPPDISPEKQNARASLSNNDSFPNRSEYLDRFKPDPFSSQNNPNRPKVPSIFDTVISNPFENKRPNNNFDNMSRPNPFDSMISPRPKVFDNRPPSYGVQQDRFHGNSSGFHPRMKNEEEFEPQHGNFSGNSNQRQIQPTQRGNFVPGPYGGRKYF